MGSLSIRGVDSQLSSMLKQKADESKKSVNQLILGILRKQVGLEKEKRFTQKYNDLDSLFGQWSKEDFSKIQGKIDSERQIDMDLWK